MAAGPDKPVRIQLFVALLLGLVLVAAALYLWRRPRSQPEVTEGDKAASGGSAASVDSSSLSQAGSSFGVPLAVADAGAGGDGHNGLSLSEPRVVACHDKGKKTPADECDHVAAVEQALARAIEQSASCVPTSAGGGTIEYQAEVVFAKKKKPVTLSVPKSGRSMKNAKVVTACANAVKHAVMDLSVDGVQHSHAKYKISITATYPGPLRDGSSGTAKGKRGRHDSSSD